MLLQRHLARVGLSELELKLRLRLGEDRYRASQVGGGGLTELELKLRLRLGEDRYRAYKGGRVRELCFRASYRNVVTGKMGVDYFRTSQLGDGALCPNFTHRSGTEGTMHTGVGTAHQPSLLSPPGTSPPQECTVIQRVAPTLKAAAAGIGPLSETEWSALEKDLAWLASRLWPSR